MRRLTRFSSPICLQPRVLAWVLVCVALWTALMAPWVHAGHAQSPAADGLMAICSSVSPDRVSVPSDETPTFAQYQSDHCRFCLQTTDPQTPPPATPATYLRGVYTLDVRPVGGQGPSPVATLTRPAPRGPPLLHSS